MRRRQLFQNLNRAAMALAWQQLFAPVSHAQMPLMADWVAPGDVFTLGVASGEPRPDSVVLWTRLAPEIGRAHV